jgi:hypothetical protein
MSIRSQRVGVSSLGSSRRSPTQLEEDGPDQLGQLYRVWERLEFYAFLSAGSYTWYYVVFKVLDWHRFPFHLYTFELWLVVVIPIVLILLILYGIDYMFKEKED